MKIKDHHRFIKYKKYFRFLFFCFVGVISTLLHFLIFNFFRFWITLSFISSLLFAIGLSMIFNFSMNRNITFSARGHSIKKQLPRYLLVYATSMSGNFFTALFIKNILGKGFLQENLALLTGLVVSVYCFFWINVLGIQEERLIIFLLYAKNDQRLILLLHIF